MRLNTAALALAAGITTAIVYAVCAFFVAVAPGSTAAAISYVLHLDLTGLTRPLTWNSFATGLICVSLAVGLVIGVAGAVYNNLVGRRLGASDRSPTIGMGGAAHG